LVVSRQLPADPILRMAWAAGYGQVDAIKDAVDAARAAGATWRQVGAALGVHYRTAQSKYGGGQERARRYADRQRAKDQGDI
jgi:hypothetical protein